MPELIFWDIRANQWVKFERIEKGYFVGHAQDKELEDAFQITIEITENAFWEVKATPDDENIIGISLFDKQLYKKERPGEHPYFHLRKDWFKLIFTGNDPFVNTPFAHETVEVEENPPVVPPASELPLEEPNPEPLLEAEIDLSQALPITPPLWSKADNNWIKFVEVNQKTHVLIAQGEQWILRPPQEQKEYNNTLNNNNFWYITYESSNENEVSENKKAYVLLNNKLYSSDLKQNALKLIPFSELTVANPEGKPGQGHNPFDKLVLPELGSPTLRGSIPRTPDHFIAEQQAMADKRVTGWEQFKQSPAPDFTSAPEWQQNMIGTILVIMALEQFETPEAYLEILEHVLTDPDDDKYQQLMVEAAKTHDDNLINADRNTAYKMKQDFIISFLKGQRGTMLIILSREVNELDNINPIKDLRQLASNFVRHEDPDLAQALSASLENQQQINDPEPEFPGDDDDDLLFAIALSLEEPSGNNSHETSTDPQLEQVLNLSRLAEEQRIQAEKAEEAEALRKVKEAEEANALRLEEQRQQAEEDDALHLEKGQKQEDKNVLAQPLRHEVDPTQATAELRLAQLKANVFEAVTNYHEWYRGDKQHRGKNTLFLSWLNHGEKGQKKAEALLKEVKACNNYDEAVGKLQEFLCAPKTRYHRHSLSSFLLDNLNKLNDSPWKEIKPDSSNHYNQADVDAKNKIYKALN